MILFAAPQPAFTAPQFEGDPEVQGPVATALAGGTTREQLWVYRWLRTWLRGDVLPVPPRAVARKNGAWTEASLPPGEDLPAEVTVAWPPERLRGPRVVNGQRLANLPGRQCRFEGRVRFGPGFPVGSLRGHARFRVLQGATAEQILAEVFPASWRTP